MKARKLREHSERIWLAAILVAWLGLWLCSVYWPGWPWWHELAQHYLQRLDYLGFTPVRL